uniref:BED-type domain-containing protein n=1 Tax=Stegastes partitus TaxID=144197 RepID=A0A3B5A479_9TELE
VDNGGSEASKSLLGPLNDKFIYKKNEDGTINKNAVICSFCKKEFSYHRSCSSLTYHLNAKHVRASSTVTGASATVSSLRQPTFAEFGKQMSKATTEKLTNSIAKWVAADCRPISIVEDEGLKEAFQIALPDPNFQLPSRTTVMKRIHQLYGNERNAKEELLAGACHVALTGDHWTSVSNHNYLGVTAHIIDSEWKLKSFALTVSKTVTRHHADACAEQVDAVTKEWQIENKVTTIGTDSARNMVAAARQLPFEHMPCAAHMLQRTITVSLEHSGFDTALAKCRKIVGSFLNPASMSLSLACTPAHSLSRSLSLSLSSHLTSYSPPFIHSPLPPSHTPHTYTQHTHTHTQLCEFIFAIFLFHCRYVTELLGGETYVSCSVVLPALCHLNRVMDPTDEDPGYMIKFKDTFSKDLDSRKATINNRWLKVATALDPRFKDLKSIHKNERAEVCEMLRGSEAGPAAPEPTEDEPAAKKSLLLLCSSDSDSDKEELGPLAHYKVEPCIGMHECPLEWWAAHAGAYGQLSSLARKYLATPATSVPCERLFSLAGNIIQKKRAALHSDNELRHPEGARSRAAAPSRRKEPVEVVWTSGSDAPGEASSGGFPNSATWEETPGQTQDPLERLYLSAGLGTPRDPPGRAGKRRRGEGGLGRPAPPAAPATQPRISGREWMDGWTYFI